MDAIALAGILYLLVYIFGILSIIPVIDDPNYLKKISFNSLKVSLATLSQLILSFVYMFSAILLFPFLWNINKELAFGGTILRILAGFVNFISILFIIALVILSQEFNLRKPMNEQEKVFGIIGKILKENRDFLNHVTMIITLNCGGVLYNIIFFEYSLLPNWLALWGIFGCFIAILASIFLFFNKTSINSPFYLLLNVPIALQEFIFGLWLLIVGFN